MDNKERNFTIRRYTGQAKATASWILSNATEQELTELDAIGASPDKGRPGAEVQRIVDGILARVRAENLKASDERAEGE